MSELANDFKGSLQIEIVNSPSVGSVFAEKDLGKLRNNKHHCRLDELESVLENNVDQSRFPDIRGTIRTVVEQEILSRFRPCFADSSAKTLGEIITELQACVIAGTAVLKADTGDTITTLNHINTRTSPAHHADRGSGINTDTIENLRNLINTAFEVIYEKL